MRQAWMIVLLLTVARITSPYARFCAQCGLEFATLNPAQAAR
jgi:hypothetical protein